MKGGCSSWEKSAQTFGDRLTAKKSPAGEGGWARELLTHASGILNRRAHESQAIFWLASFDALLERKG